MNIFILNDWIGSGSFPSYCCASSVRRWNEWHESRIQILLYRFYSINIFLFLRHFDVEIGNAFLMLSSILILTLWYTTNNDCIARFIGAYRIQQQQKRRSHYASERRLHGYGT